MKLKRVLLAVLTFSMLALLFVPEAEARRRGGRGGRRGRGGRHGHSSRRNAGNNGSVAGHEFFGKRRTIKGFEGVQIQSSDRPGPAQYVFSTNYLNVLRQSLNEALGK